MLRILFPRCAGLDVHKRSITACRRWTKRNGQVVVETRTFGTTTPELLLLLNWLLEFGCTHVAMESTGEYWKPVYNILEGKIEILLVNARHVKSVPGRKTDVSDAEWLAELLSCGLLRGSFVPPRPQRELRALTRQRHNLVRERASVVNRLQKVLEDANIKLASVATDVMGVSARAMLEAIVEGEINPAETAELARGRLRNKKAELEQALVGRVLDHHRFLIAAHLTHIDFLDEQIGQFSQAIASHVEKMPPLATPSNGSTSSPSDSGELDQEPFTYAQAIVLLDTIPGVDRRIAEGIASEIGIDMSRFPSANHISSWAGVSPGNNESAGKRRSGKTPPGNPALRKWLVLAAHAASHTKSTYLAAQYHRVVARRGKKRAIVAVAHSILVISYHILSRCEPYRELGGNYFDERKRESVVNRLVHRLEKLGYQVALETQPRVAVAAT